MGNSIENKEGKYCQKCGELIHKKAVMCPHCKSMVETFNGPSVSKVSEKDADEKNSMSPLSIISLIAGILGLLLFCVPFMNIAFAITATVLGSLDLRNIQNCKSSEKGKGLDIAGITCGGIGIIISIISLIMFITDPYF